MSFHPQTDHPWLSELLKSLGNQGESAASSIAELIDQVAKYSEEGDEIDAALVELEEIERHAKALREAIENEQMSRAIIGEDDAS